MNHEASDQRAIPKHRASVKLRAGENGELGASSQAAAGSDSFFQI